MTWHIESNALERYAAGAIDTARAFSVEAHLLSCETCRNEISQHVDQNRLDQMWSNISEAVISPKVGLIESVLRRFGVNDHVARLIAATPSLRLSWLLAVAVVLAFAVAAGYDSSGGFVMFLCVAPLLPLAGVAAAYGPGIDPTYEIGIASPLRSFRLLLIRAAAVLASTMTMTAIAALLLPGFNWTAAAWLLPSLGVATSTLALSTLIHPLRAAAVVAGAWIATAGGGALLAVGEGELRSVFGDFMQLAFIAVTCLAVALIIARRDQFERGEHQ